MKTILGTMTLSGPVDEPESARMLDLFHHSGHEELDTAYQYNQGGTERLLGELLSGDRKDRFRLATKVNPWDMDGLKPSVVSEQFTESLKRLRVDSVDLLYLHAPDPDTPIIETLEVCWGAYRSGKFRRFGLSNYAAWQVAEIVEICRARGWMIPTVYQGLYNALNRDVERELLVCLRNYGISFYAYNPLAGGMLTGKHASLDGEPPPGRFENNPAYLSRYWKADHFAALEAFTSACRDCSIPPAQAALRWLVHHSGMSTDHGDGVIVGASAFGHLEQNIRAIGEGGLPKTVTDALDSGWDAVRADCFPYFR